MDEVTDVNEKTKKAFELLKERKATIRKAAALAEVSYVEMLDLMSKAGIDTGYTIKDLRGDVTLLSPTSKRQDAWSRIQEFPRRKISPQKLACELEAIR